MPRFALAALVVQVSLLSGAALAQTATVVPPSGASSTTAQVRVEGLPANGGFEIHGGTDRQHMVLITSARSDQQGRLTSLIKIPESPTGEYHLAIKAGDRMIYAEPAFKVQGASDQPAAGATTGN